MCTGTPEGHLHLRKDGGGQHNAQVGMYLHMYTYIYIIKGKAVTLSQAFSESDFISAILFLIGHLDFLLTPIFT